jgi:hypothetical protein
VLVVKKETLEKELSCGLSKKRILLVL